MLTGPVKPRILVAWLLLSCLTRTACTQASPVQSPPVDRAKAPASSAPISPGCAPLVERAMASGRHVSKLGPAGPSVSLTSLLLANPPRAAAPAGTLTKVGSLRVERADRRLSALDVAWRTPPAELVTSHLTGAQRSAWERAAEARRALVDGYLLAATLRQARSDCDVVSCPQAACLRDWQRAQEEVVLPARRDSHVQARLEAIEQFEAARRRDPKDSDPHLAFALAGLLEDVAMQSDQPPNDVLRRVESLRRIAVSKSEIASPFGWYARYELGRMLWQEGNVDEAIAVWSTIESVAPPPKVSELEVPWRIAQADVTDASAAWESVMLRCPMQQETNDVFCPAAAYQWMSSAYERAQWRKAIDAAARLITYMDQNDHGMDARPEAHAVLAHALDALGGKGDGLPLVPSRDAGAVKDLLDARIRARSAPKELDAEISARVSALVESCLDQDDEGSFLPVFLRVNVERGGTLRVHAATGSKGELSDGVRRCLQDRGAWFFRDARSGVEVTAQ